MSEISKTLDNIPEVSFIEDISLDGLEKIMIADFENKYKELTGDSIALATADPSRLILYACALQIYQLYQLLDRAGKRDLLKYSTGNYLENLGALKGVTRLPAAPAKTILKFSLEETRLSATGIPAGTRVTGSNSNLYFATDKYVEIQPGSLYAEVSATCETVGAIGNGYIEGKLDTIVDLVPYVNSVQNISKTEGGADIEADKDLAERIYLAPSSYSVAGPEDAYRYWTKAYNANIDDIKVSSPSAGNVYICFLIDGNLPNESMINGLEEFLMRNNIRPMTDFVTVMAPNEVLYNIDIKYFINRSDSNQAVTINIAVEKAIQEYVNWQRKIGRDINPSELIKRIISAGAKRAEVTEPVYAPINETTVAGLNTSNVVYGGIEDD